jgi:hypothetical protein
VLIGVGPLTTPGHGSSPTGVKKSEGSTGVPLRASPKLTRRCGDRATVMKLRRWRSLVVGELKLGARGKGGGEGAVRSGGVKSFYRVRGKRRGGSNGQ